MSNMTNFNRALVALGMALALGFAPSLGVYAQSAQKQKEQPQQQAQVADTRGERTKGEQANLVGSRLIPMSDAEMEAVEGGFPVAIGIGLAGLAVGAYSLYRSHRSHQQILQACRAPRR